VQEHQTAEQEQPRAVAAPEGAVPDVGSRSAAVLALQARAGNRAVAQRLSGLETGAGDDAGATAEAPPVRCGGAVMTGTSVDEGGAGAEPLSAGGVATRQLSWSDFAAAEETLDLDAQTGYSFSSSGSTFTAHFDPSQSWAKPSAKTATGQADLLRHEQYHLDLATLMAQKATAAGQGGQPAMNTLVARCRAQTILYDTQTAHGTVPAQQSAWEGRIDAGTVPYSA
jgi:hypothetical protein